jgi:CheY-like chemotaxis protein/predicted Zn-dependent protease
MTKPPIRYSKKTVLIVEDFSQYAYSLRGMMINIGSTQVDLAYNGESAIQACKEHKYDIILCDYNLGDSKDGQQVLEELHRFNLLKKSSVFIIVTAENTREMVMGAIEFQPDSYLTKPFNGHTLKFRLDKAITKKEIIAPIAILIQKKKYKAAIKACYEVIESYPKFKMTCLKHQYECFKQLKLYKEALKLTTYIVNERPITWAMLGIGEIFYLQKQLEKADAAFRDLVESFPLVPDGYDWLAKVQYERGQTAQAQATLIKAVLISPKALERQRMLGKLAEENDDFDTMSEAFRQAVKCGKHSAFASPNEFIKLTRAIGMQLKGSSDIDRDRLIEEANSVFSKLNEQFDYHPTTKFRSEVAQADFSSITNNKKQVDKHLKLADRFYDRVEEMLSANESIEISDSLKHLGKQDMAEMILEDAVEQYFDDPKFMKSASRLTNNKHLLINAKKADLLNKKATLLFKKQEFKGAIENFTKATQIAPNNVDINLNHAQALLKCFIANKDKKQYLEQAEDILNNIPCLSMTDPRNQRHLELLRLSQVIQQSI